MRKSMPNLARHRLTKPRSSTACFMPTKLGALSAISDSVSRVTLTAARPGMW